MADVTFDIYDANNTKVVDAQASPVSITGLKPNTTYKGYQATYAGKSDKTAIPDFTTLDVVSGAPTLAVTPGDGKVDVTLTAGTNSGSDVTDYKVYYTDGKTPLTMDLKGSLTGTITGLTNGTEYTFQAVAVNGAGESDKSSSVTSTPVAPKPTVGSVTTTATTATIPLN
ncbi:major tail protein [Lactobacillus phage 3-521]|uniref:Fibronectin type-III domain-containing protein n=1 Tax=Lactobacillus phage 3-521 TaxID=2510943 RepID=A0A4Y5FEZ7_9CAUD|nr:major tail protein [Lactobacillus phage 3-521]QBJ03645.1 hypothetical protein UCC3521_0107 [Lactobacillus phage 3-521]